MKIQPKHSFLVRADFFGDIKSNQRIPFWLASSRGVLKLTDTKIQFLAVSTLEKIFEIELGKIVKVKMQSLKPTKNQWIRGLLGCSYYLWFWNPFWNRYLLNITYLGKHGIPRELFFKLKTKRITKETMEIIKKILN